MGGVGLGLKMIYDSINAPCIEHVIFYNRPSTFAQAAKLRRMAAAKEKDLAKSM